MQNPWSELPAHGPYVLEIDRFSIDQYSRSRRNADENIILESIPEPFIGKLQSAKVVLLGLNPGHSEDDAKAHSDPDFRGATLRNCAYGLKKSGILAINIADVAAYQDLARVFLRYAEDNGWRLIGTLQLQLSKMVGLKHLGKGAFKTEPIYVFKKK